MRFCVIDDEGKPLRRFHTKQEAEAFCLEGWTVSADPKPPKLPKHWAVSKLLEEVGESPY